MRTILALLLCITGSALLAADSHPILPIGSPAPDFALPSVDGKTHKLGEYTSPVLVIVFTCNHCPIAQMYEDRINQLVLDYKDKGVSVVAIQGNDPKAIRIDELDSSDLSDTLAEMKIRVASRHLNYPYLYDGDTQSVTRQFGPQATPHVFVFDKERKLRYEGHFDNSYRIELVKSQDARNAIDSLLAGKPVAVTHTGVFGCSTKWSEKHSQVSESERKIAAEPVRLEMVGADDLKKLRGNSTGKYLLINFWATWCGSCVHEFSDLQDTYQMYRVRGDFDYVTVSANMPDEKASVLRFLESHHASARNLLFASEDTESLQKAFNPKWESAVPYTAFIAPDGLVLYEKQGDVDILELRRKILSVLPAGYKGFQKYWLTQ